MKQLLKIVSSLVAMLLAIQPAAAFDFEANGLCFEIVSETQKTCRVTNDKVYSGDVVIPETVSGYTVTEIGEAAFKACSRVTSVTIPSSVTVINDNAFSSCSALSQIIIPNSVTYIGAVAFSGCGNLQSVKLSENLGYLGWNSFHGCGALSSIKIPDSLTKIEIGTFRNCTALKTIDWGKSLSKIDGWAFENCTSLTQLLIPGNITSIGEDCFNKCSNIKSLEFIDNGNTVKLVGGAFSSCTGLETVILPDNLKIIPEVAFSNCQSLKEIKLPLYLKTIQPEAFRACGQIKDLVIPPNVTDIYSLPPVENLIITGSIVDRLEFPNTFNHLVVKEGVEYIGANAFSTSDITRITTELINPPSIGQNTFSSWTMDNAVISIPENSIENYRTDTIWSKFKYFREPSQVTQSLSLSAQSLTLYIGQQTSLEVNVLPDLDVLRRLQWTTSDEKVATVDQNGVVTAIGRGDAVITAKAIDDSGISASCSINVIKLVSGITLSVPYTTLTKNQTISLYAYIKPRDADNKVLEWTSNDISVAIVDQEGVVTAISEGSAVITAKATDGSEVSASCKVNVVKFVSDIELNKTSVKLAKNKTINLYASITPEDATNKILEWSSNNSSVAIVDDNGKVRAWAEGSAVITAKATDGSGVSASCDITVGKPVYRIELNENSLTLTENQIVKLTAYITPEDAIIPYVEWSSSDNSVAVVDNDGVVTAIAEGSVVIKANATDGSSVSASCYINVGKPITSIDFKETSIDLDENQDCWLYFTITPEDAINQYLEWSSSDTSVAIIENNIITAVAPGTAIITAKATDGSGISASCEVNVHPVPYEIILSENEIHIREKELYTLMATVLPVDTWHKDVNWDTSDYSIADIGYRDGVVYGRSKGHCVIRARLDFNPDIISTCDVFVEDVSDYTEINQDSIVQIYTREGDIVVADKSASEIVRVYTLSGTLVAETNDNVIKNLISGIYIVRVADKITKVAL